VPRHDEIDHAIPSISELVARIEKLRQGREGPAEKVSAAPEAASAPDAGSLFRWECGPSGEISWVDGVPRGALVGRSLATAGEISGVDERVSRAFAMRAPFRDADLTIAGEGVAAGEWKISGIPAFEPTAGRFAGYRGVAARADGQPPARGEARRALDHDSIRELVHEIRTPLNAIIGFAEMIDGQYLGPAEFEYRERAAEIVAHARLLLGAVEDLDLAAQLRAAPAQANGSTDLAAVVRQSFGELADRATQRGVTLALEASPGQSDCALSLTLVERLVRRFCKTLIDSAATGQRLELIVGVDADHCLLSLDEPKGAQGQEKGSQAALPFELSLRLVRALVSVAGGDLLSRGGRATLLLPRSRD
jgi:signal transduction histidine kinase